MELRSCGAEELWSCGAVELRNCGFVELWTVRRWLDPDLDRKVPNPLRIQSNAVFSVVSTDFKRSGNQFGSN